MTWSPSPETLAASHAHAMRCQPSESCGVVIGGAFYPVTNRSTQHDAFCMDSSELVLLEEDLGPFEAIVHSHVYAPPLASEADRTACEATKLPWLIVSWPTGAHAVIEPWGFRAPLVGRTWAWRYHDCFALIRDGLADYAGIALPDFDRQWEWWKHEQDIIGGQFEAAGFVDLGPKAKPQHCDVIGMRVPPSRVVNHLGLFLAPDVLLHHMMGRLSVRQVYGGIYQHATRYVLRHRTLLETTLAQEALA
jgi:proteasome lid subunit RPN8/RPN11